MYRVIVVIFCLLCECSACNRKGLIYSRKDVIKHSGITNLDGDATIVEPKVKNELVGDFCQIYNGKGKLTYRCRYKDRVKVLYEKKTESQGGSAFKDF